MKKIRIAIILVISVIMLISCCSCNKPGDNDVGNDLRSIKKLDRSKVLSDEGGPTSLQEVNEKDDKDKTATTVRKNNKSEEAPNPPENIDNKVTVGDVTYELKTNKDGGDKGSDENGMVKAKSKIRDTGEVTEEAEYIRLLPAITHRVVSKTDTGKGVTVEMSQLNEADFNAYVGMLRANGFNDDVEAFGLMFNAKHTSGKYFLKFNVDSDRTYLSIYTDESHFDLLEKK